jgi:hypothetical protein
LETPTALPVPGMSCMRPVTPLGLTADGSYPLSTAETAASRIGDQGCQPVSNAKLPLGSGHQHHGAIRGQAATVKGGDHFLTADGWKTEWLNRILGHGGCGSAQSLPTLRIIRKFRITSHA